MTILGDRKQAYSLPLELSQDYATVHVTIEGKQIPLLLDLGGFSTIALSDSVLSTLSVKFAGTRSYDDAYGNSHKVRNYVVPSAELGTLRLENIEGTEQHTDLARPGRVPTGYLGIRFLRSFARVIFDYPHSRLILLRDTVLPADYRALRWTSIPYYGDEVRSHASMDSVDLEFLWDTGASHSVLTNKAFNRVKQNRKKALGENGGYLFYEADRLQIGALETGPLSLVLLDLPEPGVDAILGHNFFGDHIVMIDFESSTIGIVN